MTSGGNDDGSIDSVRIHARLVVVVHSNQSPVGDNTSDADSAVGVVAGDEIFDGGGVEELDVGEGENL